MDTINAVAPVGWTPTGAALLAALDDFSQFDPATNSNFVYLISDGLETCDGDPAAAAAQLNSANVGVTVNVVGFAVDAETTQELQKRPLTAAAPIFRPMTPRHCGKSSLSKLIGRPGASIAPVWWIRRRPFIQRM